MTFRGQHVVRCGGCLIEASRCLCDAIPRLEARTRVVVVMHAVEGAKPTNTGRFVQPMLPNGVVVRRGVFHQPDEPVPDLGDRPRWLLHPDAARELSPADAVLDPVLLVADGTWSQARRLLRRVPELAAAERVRLPPGPPGRYLLRRHPSPSHLSTLEAVGRAIAVLEGEEVAAPLERFFDLFVRTTLATRGVVLRDASDDAR